MRTLGPIGWAALALLSWKSAVAEPESDSSGLEVFEQRIRPLLADHCYSCHSQHAEKLKGGLLLDSAEGFLKGGDSGPAIIPGDPEKSLLIKAVSYTDPDLQMPPKNKRLAPDQVRLLEAWVKLGAPAPKTSTVPTAKAGVSRSKHWAFQPVQRPALPAVKDAGWVQSPIDQFILAKLEANGLAPSPRAAKRTLIRRVTFDLTGLPPTSSDVAAFLEDDAPDAYARVVERLLSSPQYGERWARHWLDVARYADTKGYVFEEERRYPYAYTYRDYVVRAFNEDLPFDQFIIEQIAADRLPLGQDKQALAALGYLTLGRRFLNHLPDIIDDRIDVVTRGMMGLTVACARCHDHKFDPITTKDYYALYGVFASCSEPENEPILSSNRKPAHYAAYLREHEKRLQELNRFQEAKEFEIRTQLRRSVGEYLLAAHDEEAVHDESLAEALARERKLDPGIVRQWRTKLHEWKAKQASASSPFALWFALSECPPEDFARHAAAILERDQENEASQTAQPLLVRQAFAGVPPCSLLEVADRYGWIFAEVDRIWQATLHPGTNSEPAQTDPPSAPAALPDPSLEAIRQVLYGTDSPTSVAEQEIQRLFDVPSIQKLRALKRKLDELDATHPGAPARAMALQDNPTPVTPRVFLRGNPSNLGPEVPRRFLSLLGGSDQARFQDGSGRLELARAIANRKNPLTARVLVNRVWLQYFGAGLVRTPSDFGLRSEPPSHPELLDYLAGRFMDEGWSLKKLHRWIVLSSTYQQVSYDRPDLAQRDPSNQWLGRMNRRRLDFEALRDSLLFVGGQLDLDEGGQAVDITKAPWSHRRTLYGFVQRQNLPGLFRTFDFASPDTTSPQRFSTSVPQQALFLMNSPFVVEQGRLLCERPILRSAAGGEDRVRALYRIVYQREPTSREMELALKFVTAQGTGAWERYAQVLLMANEFCFLD
jgi:mono/diheme cytochrome c family protein